MVVSIVSFLDLLENIFTRFDDVEVTLRGVAIVATPYYIYVLTYGIMHFSDLAAIQGPVAPDDFNYDYLFMIIVLCVSLLTELSIAIPDHGPDDRIGRYRGLW
jgi:hypothetical protein